nr:reverse transcriptase domain-containing protein [Tanacetum cinerariifolium]
IDVIHEILEEDFNALLGEGSKVLHSIEGTLLEEEIFAKFDKFMAMNTKENSEFESDTEDPPFEKITINTDYKIKTSLEEPPTDLKHEPLPDNMEYVFLEEPLFLFVIISSQLSEKKKHKLVSVLKKHKQAFDWKTTDIPGICPSLYKNKIQLLDDTKLVVQKQRSPWVSPIHCVPKKGGITVVTNENDELVPTRIVTCWREEIVLGHKVSSTGLDVDKANIDVISKLPPPTKIKDALILMPKFASTLKALIRNKEKLSEMARTLLNEHCSAVLLNKLPEKLGDPGKFMIPCDFLRMAECLALADLNASINLMPWSVWKRLFLPDLKPTCITLELADRLISRPVRVAEDVYVKLGSFHFPADFAVVDFDADPRVPLILRRSFLKTGRALIDVFEGELTLREVLGFSDVTANGNPTPYYDLIVSITSSTLTPFRNSDFLLEEEVLGFSDVTANGNPTPYYDPIVSITSPTLTPFRNSDFLLEEVDAFLAIEDDPTSLEVDQSYLDPEGDILFLEAFLNDDTSLPPLNQGNYRPKVRKELKICTFLRFMMAIFHDMIEKTMEVFMDDFSVFENSFQSYISHFKRMLKRCEDTNLCLNWEKSHFMVKEGIILGHKISKQGILVDKAKVDVITKLPHPTTVKGVKDKAGVVKAPITMDKDKADVVKDKLTNVVKDKADVVKAMVAKDKDKADVVKALVAKDKENVDVVKAPVAKDNDKDKAPADLFVNDKASYNVVNEIQVCHKDIATRVYPYGTVELSQPDEPNFKVNGHPLKHYFREDVPKVVVSDLQTFLKDN